MKVWVYVVIGIPLGLAVLGMIGNHPETPQERDRRSVGYLAPSECMSGAEYNKRAQLVVENTDWSKMAGSATWSAGTRTMIGAVKVFDEMQRLGARACPDLAPLYEKFLAAKTPVAAPAISSGASLVERVQLKTGGNIRRDPSTKAPIVRVAQQGDILRKFGGVAGWVHVGRDAPEGWIAESVVNPK